MEKLLAERAVFTFDLAWHQALDEWKPLLELAASLRKLEILQCCKSAPFTEAMLQQKLFYAAHDGEIRGPFFLDDLNPLLAKRLIATSELAWHNSIAGWQPLSELVRILEEQQSFRLSGFLLFMNWLTSGRWMARPSRPDLISTPQTISKSPQPFDERIDAFSLSRPYLNTKQDIEEFFKKQDAPPVIIDEYGGTAVRITSYESDMARLKELIESFLEEKALADDKKIQPVKTPQNTKNILILLRLIYHRYI